MVGLAASTFICCRKLNQRANGADIVSLLSEVERLVVTLTHMVMMLICMMGMMKESLAIETSEQFAISIRDNVHVSIFVRY